MTIQIPEYIESKEKGETPLYDYRVYATADIPALLAAAEQAGTERERTDLQKLSFALQHNDGLRGKSVVYCIYKNGHFQYAYSRHWIQYPPARPDDDTPEWLEEAAQNHVTALYEHDREQKERSAADIIQTAFLRAVAQDADLTDEQLAVVGRAGFFDEWQPGEIYPANKRLSHDGITYVVMQEVTAQEHQPPGGTGMLAVYRPVGVAGEAEADGSPEYPYTLVAGMEGVAGKYYRHADKLWECLRDMQNIIESWLPGSPGMETFWREVQPAAAALSAPAPAEEPSPIAAPAPPAAPVVPVVDAPMAVDTPAPAEDSRGVVAAPIPVPAAERYFLNSSRSTYHMLDCDDAQTGSLRTLDYIAQNHAATARPCAKCNPPALAV